MANATPTRYRQKVTLESPPSTVDTLGHLSGSWTNEGTRRCSINRINGNLTNQGEKTSPIATYQIRFRYNASLQIDTTWRLDYNGTKLYIGDVQDDFEERKEYIILASTAKD